MPFKANYFDGKTSQIHVAYISPCSIAWKISFYDKENSLMQISWNTQNIKRSEVYTKGLISFTYGNTFPFQKIESSDNRFIEYLNNSNHKNLNNRVNTFLHKYKKRSIASLLLAVFTILFTIYFYVIPTVVINFVSKLNKTQIIEFGNYTFNILLDDLDIDKEKSNKLQLFINDMNINTTFPIKAYVVNNKELNAFALSGGKIVIYSSLLNKIENEHQLTALIGHEISHIENRHILKNLSRNVSGKVFLSIIFNDFNSISAGLTKNAHLFSQLSYSRNLENEADICSMEIMRKNNLNLFGMPELFQILKKENEIEIPKYLNNHPVLKDRILYTKKIAEKQSSFKENVILKNRWNNLKQLISKTNTKTINE